MPGRRLQSPPLIQAQHLVPDLPQSDLLPSYPPTRATGLGSRSEFHSSISMKSESMSVQVVSDDFFDVNYTRKRGLKPILDYIKCKPFKGQRTIFFKLLFSVALAPRDFETLPLSLLISIGPSFGLLFNRPVDFSNYAAVLQSCNQLVPTVRWDLTPAQRCAALIELFLNTLYLDSRQTPEGFAGWVFQRYFEEGFDRQRFERQFDIRFFSGGAKIASKPKRIKVEVRDFEDGLMSHLGRCSRFVKDFSCFASVDMIPNLISQIKEDFLKMLHGYVKLFTLSNTFDQEVVTKLQRSAKKERQKFRWTVYELTMAVKGFMGELTAEGAKPGQHV